MKLFYLIVRMSQRCVYVQIKKKQNMIKLCLSALIIKYVNNFNVLTTRVRL